MMTCPLQNLQEAYGEEELKSEVTRSRNGEVNEEMRKANGEFMCD